MTTHTQLYTSIAMRFQENVHMQAHSHMPPCKVWTAMNLITGNCQLLNKQVRNVTVMICSSTYKWNPQDQLLCQMPIATTTQKVWTMNVYWTQTWVTNSQTIINGENMHIWHLTILFSHTHAHQSCTCVDTCSSSSRKGSCLPPPSSPQHCCRIPILDGNEEPL